MIGVSQISVVAFRGGGGSAPNPDFISTWDTTQAGSASDTVVLPLLSGGTYSGTIDWGDGSTSALSYANRTHTYAIGGTYTITISGSDIQGFRFNNGGDRRKITDVSNWGNLTLTTNGCFYGCSNLEITATDAPTIATTDFKRMFDGSGITNPDLSKWDVSLVQLFENCFNQTSFNGNISTWVGSATNVRSMFRLNTAFNGTFVLDFSNVTDAQEFATGATAFNQPLVNVNNLVNGRFMLYNADAYDQVLDFDVSAATDLRDLMTFSTGLSTVNYDATLIAFESSLQAAYPGGVGYPATIVTNFGGSTYTLGGAGETARTSLISTFGWTITDGGGV